jgi:hypothetical protein
LVRLESLTYDPLFFPILKECEASLLGEAHRIMDKAATENHEQIKREWTDQFVTVNPDRPELKRFAGIVGRVVTVNWNNKAVIDFQDGGWYDITASSDYLTRLDPTEAKPRFDSKANSAQPFPERQS